MALQENELEVHQGAFTLLCFPRTTGKWGSTASPLMGWGLLGVSVCVGL